MILSSFAKINLGLKVSNKRDDGFHDLDMIVQSISLCDYITLRKSSFRKITVSCNKNICNQEQNLAYISAKSVLERCNVNFGIDIHIEKNIPIGAGLGGGSSNAAAVIVGLSRVLNLSNKQILEIASEIGADVPFCCLGGTYRCRGKGEILDRVSCLKDCKILIKKGNVPYFTKNAYEKLDKFFENKNYLNSNDSRVKNLINSLKHCDIKKISDSCFNDFENIIETSKDWHLTGSGSASFKLVSEDFTNYDNNVIIYKPVNFGVEILEDNWN